MVETKRTYECPDCLGPVTVWAEACPGCGWISKELDPAGLGPPVRERIYVLLVWDKIARVEPDEILVYRSTDLKKAQSRAAAAVAGGSVATIANASYEV